MEINSMSEAIRFVIDGMPEGTCFFGNELKTRVVRIFPEEKLEQHPQYISEGNNIYPLIINPYIALPKHYGNQ